MSNSALELWQLFGKTRCCSPANSAPRRKAAQYASSSRHRLVAGLRKKAGRTFGKGCPVSSSNATRIKFSRERGLRSTQNLDFERKLPGPKLKRPRRNEASDGPLMNVARARTWSSVLFSAKPAALFLFQFCLLCTRVQVLKVFCGIVLFKQVHGIFTTFSRAAPCGPHFFYLAFQNSPAHITTSHAQPVTPQSACLTLARLSSPHLFS